MTITTVTAAGDLCLPSIATLATNVEAALTARMPRVHRAPAQRQEALLAAIAQKVLAR